MSRKRASILFVGAFGAGKSRDGHTGGQLFACRSLLDSPLGKKYHWLLIDSMAETNKHRFFFLRLWKAFMRMFKFLWFLPKCDKVLLFSSAGFSFMEKGLMAVVAGRLGKRVIFAPRSGLVQDEWAGSFWKRRFAACVLKNANYVICQSAFWVSFYRNLGGGPAEKYVYLPNWIAPEVYLKNRPQINVRRGGKRLKVLFMGWITKNKGVFDLVELAASMGKEAPDFYLAGDGDAYEQLQKQIRNAGLQERVHLTGWLDFSEKLKYLQMADVFILPSYRDGYPNALLEAMASGLACIASDTGGIPDMMLNGKTGLLVQPGAVEEMASALRLLQKDEVLRVNLGLAARRHIQKNNSIEKAVAVFDYLFAERQKQNEKHESN